MSADSKEEEQALNAVFKDLDTNVSKLVTANYYTVMRTLCNRKVHTIGEKDYTVQHRRPGMKEDLLKDERDIIKELDPEKRYKMKEALLKKKAKLYIGMADEDWENIDIDDLNLVISACELRDNPGFRQL